MRISLSMEKMRESQGQKKVSPIQKLRMRNRWMRGGVSGQIGADSERLIRYVMLTTE